MASPADWTQEGKSSGNLKMSTEKYLNSQKKYEKNRGSLIYETMLENLTYIIRVPKGDGIEN